MIGQMKLFSLLLLLTVTNLFAQSGSVQDFVIDQSKPYVYLKFDHIGPRKPVQDGEDDTSIWLRVVNNCRIPIVFLSFDMPDGNPGVGLMDEIVETEPILQIYDSADEEAVQAKLQEHLRKLKQKPNGYMSETPGVVRVQPGKEILFSVPLNHVDMGGNWYMRVRFALDLNRSSASVGPFTYLPFGVWDIPKELRPAKTPNAIQEPKKPPSKLLPEPATIP